MLHDSKEQQIVHQLEPEKPKAAGEDGSWIWEIQDIQNKGHLHEGNWTSIVVHVDWNTALSR
jgi:hypothetical protein